MWNKMPVGDCDCHKKTKGLACKYRLNTAGLRQVQCSEVELKTNWLLLPADSPTASWVWSFSTMSLGANKAPSSSLLMKTGSSVSSPGVILLLTFCKNSPPYSVSSSSNSSTRAMYFNALDLSETKTTTKSPIYVSILFFKIFFECVFAECRSTANWCCVKRSDGQVVSFREAKPLLFASFLVLCQEFGTLKLFFSATSYACCLHFSNDKLQYMSAKQLMWHARSFSMSAGIILWRRLFEAYPTAQSGSACFFI